MKKQIFAAVIIALSMILLSGSDAQISRADKPLQIGAHGPWF